LEFVIWDDNVVRKDTPLASLRVEREELLTAKTTLLESQWKHFRKPLRMMVHDDGNHNNDRILMLEFKLMVTKGNDRIVSQEDLQVLYTPTEGEWNDGYVYSEKVLHQAKSDDDPSGQALLQCWNKDGNTKAVLWIVGRNDCFMHPHVAKELFFGGGNKAKNDDDNKSCCYDLYVLNYQMVGHCRKKGWIADAHFNSHNFSGNFDIYIADIEEALSYILLPGNNDNNNYETMLGYAHSTGAPILLNYIMEKGDAAFDSFIFNSPFLDWGFVGGDMVEFMLKHTGFMTKLHAMKNDSKLGVASTPQELTKTPIPYLQQNIVMSDWSARLWSLYYFDFEIRPLYKVPMTVGFAKGVTAVHRKLERLHTQHQRAVTTKPFLCITDGVMMY
jgi:hypothetical protein